MEIALSVFVTLLFVALCISLYFNWQLRAELQGSKKVIQLLHMHLNAVAQELIRRQSESSVEDLFKDDK